MNDTKPADGDFLTGKYALKDAGRGDLYCALVRGKVAENAWLLEHIEFPIDLQEIYKSSPGKAVSQAIYSLGNLAEWLFFDSFVQMCDMYRKLDDIYKEHNEQRPTPH